MTIPFKIAVDDLPPRNVKDVEAFRAFWQRKIATLGMSKAQSLFTEVMKRVGVTARLELKSVEWQGLTLKREPTELEALCVKGIATAQDAGKEKIAKALLSTRKDLNKEAVAALRNISPAEYHTLTVTPPDSARKLLRGLLSDVYERGRELVVEELAKQKPGKSRAVRTKAGDLGDEFLDELTDLTLGRLSNTVQSGAVEGATSYRILGLDGEDFFDALEAFVDDLSDAPVERIAREVVNAGLSGGRSDEAQARADEWKRVEYSALLDPNTCGPCEEADGTSAQDEDELPPAPNPECEGGGQCRCFHVFVSVDEV